MPIVVQAVQRTSVLQVNRKQHLPLWVGLRVTPVQTVRPERMQQKVLQVVAIVLPIHIPMIKPAVVRLAEQINGLQQALALVQLVQPRMLQPVYGMLTVQNRADVTPEPVVQIA